MSAETRLARTRFQQQREVVIAALQKHFADDELDLEDFERRMTVAHATSSLEELQSLTEDLLPVASPARNLAPSADTALAPAPAAAPLQTVRGFMSATTRVGPWNVPRRLQVRGMMSSTVLDFRQALFPPGPVDLEVRAVMSSVEIIVPPGLAVETAGRAIMGVFEDVQQTPAGPVPPGGPVLRIRGLAFMGAVEIRTMLPAAGRLAQSGPKHRKP